MRVSDSGVFLQVKTGDYVVVDNWLISENPLFCDNWVGYVICVIPGSRDPFSSSLFQVMNVDTFIIKIINADSVVSILANNSFQSKC